jgi:AcrR family transcriptional regulator
MARPKNDERRNAIMSAATRVFALHGLSASTALIGKEAAVSNGSLFTYFETKSDLFNRLYLELKEEMVSAITDGLDPEHDDPRELVLHMWNNWIGWAMSHAEKRRAQALLAASDDLTTETREAAHQKMAGVLDILERIRKNGPMSDSSLRFVAALTNAMTEATVDFMLRDPGNADAHSRAGFEAVWRTLGGTIGDKKSD